MKEDTIFFDKIEKTYFFFQEKNCICCGNEIKEGMCFIKILYKPKEVKKFYCDSPDCVRKYNQVEQSGQIMVTATYSIYNDEINLDNLKPVLSFKSIMSASNSYRDAVSVNTKLLEKKCKIVVDRALLSKESFLDDKVKIGADIKLLLEKKEKDVDKDEFALIMNAKPITPNLLSYEELKKLE